MLSTSPILSSRQREQFQELKEMITTTRDYFICIINVPLSCWAAWDGKKVRKIALLWGEKGEGWKMKNYVNNCKMREERSQQQIFSFFLRDEHRISANRENLLSPQNLILYTSRQWRKISSTAEVESWEFHFYARHPSWVNKSLALFALKKRENVKIWYLHGRKMCVWKCDGSEELLFFWFY